MFIVEISGYCSSIVFIKNNVIMGFEKLSEVFYWQSAFPYVILILGVGFAVFGFSDFVVLSEIWKIASNLLFESKFPDIGDEIFNVISRFYIMKKDYYVHDQKTE